VANQMFTPYDWWYLRRKRKKTILSNLFLFGVRCEELDKKARTSVNHCSKRSHVQLPSIPSIQFHDDAAWTLLLPTREAEVPVRWLVNPSHDTRQASPSRLSQKIRSALIRSCCKAVTQY
jgi:hypothetical protein